MSSAVMSPIAWIANTPSRWTVAPLGTCFYERSETVSDADFAPLSVTKVGVVPQLDHVAKTDNNANRKLVREGDFVINSRSDRKGSAGLSKLDGSVSVVYTVLTPRPSLDGRFTHHLLRSTAFQEEFYRWGSGIAADLWSTRYSAMKNIPLAIPPLEEQRAIADYLDQETAQIDALVAKQEEFIGLLRERRQSQISDIFTSLGAPNTQLRRVAHIQTGITLSGDGDPSHPQWPYLRVANVQMGRVDLSHVKEIHLPPAEAATSMLRAGDVLMTEGGDIDKLGRGTVWDGSVERMVHQNHVFAVRAKLGRLMPAYLAWWLDTSIAREYFYLTAKKTTNLASTNKTVVGRLPIHVPDVSRQYETVKRISEQTTRIDALIAKAEEHIALAKERRSALITAAVTGQFDVRTAKKGARI